MKTTIDTDIGIEPSKEALICLTCERKRCNPDNCERYREGIKKINGRGKEELKKVNWRWDWGVYAPFCPYCDEPAYSEDHCVFCQKKYKWRRGRRKPTLVEHEGYKALQDTNNHISVYDEDGKIVMHSSCNRKFTENELKTHIEFVKGIRESNR